MKIVSSGILLTTLVVVLMNIPFQVDAASLYIDPSNSNLNRGDSVTLSVRLDTDEAAGECVNAVDGVIKYPENIEPVDISTGSSIFSIWVETPKINKDNRTITFAGGIPNGYCGRVIGDPRLSNVLAEIIFRSPGFSVGGSNVNTATIEFGEESTAYLNDGRGTKAALNKYPAVITLDPKPSAEMVNPWQGQVESDDVIPEEFSISLQKGDFAYSGKYFIVFNTGDKQTGIDHYEIMEEPLSQLGMFKWGEADAPWIEGRSPYQLKDQSLNSIIRVKAVDKAGNEYIANLIPDDAMKSYSTAQIMFVLVCLFGLATIVAVSILVFRFFRSKFRKRSDQSSNQENSSDGVGNEALDNDSVI